MTLDSPAQKSIEIARQVTMAQPPLCSLSKGGECYSQACQKGDLNHSVLQL